MVNVILGGHTGGGFTSVSEHFMRVFQFVLYWCQMVIDFCNQYFLLRFVMWTFIIFIFLKLVLTFLTLGKQ